MNRRLPSLPNVLSVLILLGSGLVAPSLSAAPPRVVKNAADAIQYSRSQNRPLILFALIDASEGSRHFAHLFNQNKLKLAGEEFVVSLCDASKPESVALFQNTFQLQPASLPLVVITNPGGKPMAPSLSGLQDQDDYDRMIHAALVAAGLRAKNAPLISSTTGTVISVDSKIFRITREDIMDSLISLTEFRDWKLKSGGTFHGALLKAEGVSGLFRVDGEPDPRRVVFGDLSPEDVAYLKKLLEDPDNGGALTTTPSDGATPP